MKHITLEVTKRTTKKVTFRISEQTHRGVEFGTKKDLFQASNAVELSSAGSPEIANLSCGIILFFVRGLDQKDDRKQVTTTCETFARIEEAVAEYNDHFKEGIAAKGETLYQAYDVSVKRGVSTGSYLVAAESEEEASDIAFARSAELSSESGSRVYKTTKAEGVFSNKKGIIYHGRFHEL